MIFASLLSQLYLGLIINTTGIRIIFLLTNYQLYNNSSSPLIPSPNSLVDSSCRNSNSVKGYNIYNLLGFPCPYLFALINFYPSILFGFYQSLFTRYISYKSQIIVFKIKIYPTFIIKPVILKA